MRTESNKRELSEKQRTAYLFKRDRRKRSIHRTREKKKQWGYGK